MKRNLLALLIASATTYAQLTTNQTTALYEKVVVRDFKSLILLKQNADHGHASAHNNLRVIYDNGQDVPQEYKEAVV